MVCIKDFISVSTGFFEALCMGAIFYGWSSFNYILTREGYFNSSCNETIHVSNNFTSSICPKQQYFLELAFTLAAAVPPGLCLVIGIFFDVYGTWVLRTFSSILYILSCVAIAYSSSSYSWIIYPATISVGVCGYVALISNGQTANLFANNRGFITNVLGGSLNGSLAMLTLVKLAYDHGYSLKWSFLLLSALGPFMLVRTFFLMPKSVIPSKVPEDYYYGIKECCGNIKSSEESPLLAPGSSNIENVENTPTIKSYILSPLYLLGVFSFSIQLLRMDFFMEAVNVKLLALYPHNHSLVSYNINFFGVVHFACVALGPLLGGLVDFVYYIYKKNKSLNEFQAQMKALVVQNLFASVVVIIYSLFQVFSVPELQYISYILILFSENLAFSNLGLFMLLCFPMKYYGTLYGLGLLIAAIITLLQFPLYYVAVHYFRADFLLMDIIFVILALSTLAHPIDLYLRSKLKKM